MLQKLPSPGGRFDEGTGMEVGDKVGVGDGVEDGMDAGLSWI
jgi:hypothetical protein